MRKSLVTVGAAIAMVGGASGVASAHGDGNTALVNGDVVDVDKVCVSVLDWKAHGLVSVLSQGDNFSTGCQVN